MNFVEEDTMPEESRSELIVGNEGFEYIFNLQSSKFVYATVGGVRQDFVLDTGARSNIIPRPYWLLMKEKGIITKSMDKNVNTTFKAFGATEPLKVIGKFTAELKINEKSDIESFYVLDKGDKCLLGAETIFKRGIMNLTRNVR